MKKIIFALAVIIVSYVCYLFTVPSPSATTEVTVVTVDNFLDVAKADLAAETAKSDQAVFYESQIVFTDFITADSVGIVQVMNVIQDTSTCIQIYHQGARVYTTESQSYWLEDVPVDLDKLITLDSAITRLNMADLPKPKTRTCTLRNILGPVPTTPSYIFGTRGTGFVRVDGYTGKVSVIE